MEWRNIENSPGYFISNTGLVRSPRGRILHGTDKDGYIRIFTGKKTECAHRLVAFAFLDNPFGHMEINHIDGNKKNNHVSNIEWCSRKENINHSFKTGLNKNKRGVKNNSSKLTQEQVDFFRANYIPGHQIFGQKAIAKSFGVHNSTLSKIFVGETH